MMIPSFTSIGIGILHGFYGIINISSSFLHNLSDKQSATWAPFLVIDS
jgi:hypothetical protein